MDDPSAKISEFFDKSAAKENVMMTVPEIMNGLRLDRRKIEASVVLLSKGKSPKLEEILKGRVKYYVLKEIVEFAGEKWWRKE